MTIKKNMLPMGTLDNLFAEVTLAMSGSNLCGGKGTEDGMQRMQNAICRVR